MPLQEAQELVTFGRRVVAGSLARFATFLWKGVASFAGAVTEPAEALVFYVRYFRVTHIYQLYHTSGENTKYFWDAAETMVV